MKTSYQLRVRSFEPNDFSKVSDLLQEFAQGGTLLLKGPIYLPTKKKLFTVNRSHHVHKKSRDQFLLQTHSRLWVLETTEGISMDPLLEGLGKLERISFDWQVKAQSF